MLYDPASRNYMPIQCYYEPRLIAVDLVFQTNYETWNWKFLKPDKLRFDNASSAVAILIHT